MAGISLWPFGHPSLLYMAVMHEVLGLVPLLPGLSTYILSGIFPFFAVVSTAPVPQVSSSSSGLSYLGFALYRTAAPLPIVEFHSSYVVTRVGYSSLVGAV